MRTRDCVGWGLPPDIIAKLAVRVSEWQPVTETEKRNKRIVELAFCEDMNCSQIARLNDPLIVGHGNRSKGKPLSGSSIWKVCLNFAPEVREFRNHKQRSAITEKRIALYRQIRAGQINKPKICATCGIKKDLNLHHIIPLSKGGTNDYFNLIYLCRKCHMLLHHGIYDKAEREERE